MKKMFLSLLALPLVLVACGEEKFDRGLNGTWVGKAQTTDINLLTQGNINTAALNETIIYRFENEQLTTYRAKDYNPSYQNKIEIEKGTYEANDNRRMTYKIDAHSCVGAEVSKDIEKRPTQRQMSYELSKDDKTLKISTALGQSVSLTRVDEDTAKDIDEQASMSTPGCFISNGNGKPTFKPGNVEKPKSFEQNAEAKLEDEMAALEGQVQSELENSQEAEAVESVE